MSDLHHRCGCPDEVSGTVTRWDPERGCGNVWSEDLQADVHVVFSAICAPGYRELRVGQQVWFTPDPVTGHGFFADEVHTQDAPLWRPEPEPSTAFSSSLTIVLDHEERLDDDGRG